MKKPTVFGKYLLLERVNVGGMAEVFIAKAFGVEGFERILAIKKILPTMAEDEEFITMFIDEARISVQLNHANIVHIHELGKHDGTYFIAMEYVSGRDLRTILERYRRRKEIMPTAMAVFVASKICEGLDYAHRKKDARGQDLGIIHRDVSPQNILCSYEGEVKIIDFGIAKAANRSQKTQAGILKGKFGYMSPEQVRGMPIDRRSDVFAVGVILYEMLTGEKLFVGESDFSTLEKVRNAEVPTPRQFNPNVPGGLEKVVLKSLAREPEDRYQWASDLQEDLMRFLLAGDAIYSAKHLSAFCKEAFAEDLLREEEKMQRFASIERPDQIESSGILAQPPPPQPKRRMTAPTPAVSASNGAATTNGLPPRRSSQQLPSTGGPRMSNPGTLQASGAATVAMSSAPSVTVNIPPPTAEELAEMDGAGDRTQIVDQSDVGAITGAVAVTPSGSVQLSSEGEPEERDLKTAIGMAPIHYDDAVPSADMQENVATTGDSPSADGRNGNSKTGSGMFADTGHDLRPLEQTGFRPAHSEENELPPDESGGYPGDATIPPKSRPSKQVVIGDAPAYSGATRIGPSPYSGAVPDEEANLETGDRPQIPQTRLFEEQNAGEEEQYDEEQGDEGYEEPPPEDESLPPRLEPARARPGSTRPPPPRLAPKGPPPKAALNKRLLVVGGLGATVLVALVVASVMLLRSNPARLVVRVEPDTPFTVKVSKLTRDQPVGNPESYDGRGAIVVDPGDYMLDVLPADKNLQPKRLKVHLTPGQILPLPVQKLVSLAPPPEKEKPPEKERPKPEEKAEEPKTYVAMFSSDEEHVEVTLDGKKLGFTPDLKAEGLVFGDKHKVVAKKEGFKVFTLDFTNDKKDPLFVVTLALERDTKEKPPKEEAKAPEKEKPPEKEHVADRQPEKEKPPEKERPPERERPEKKPVEVAKPEKASAKGAKGKLACASKPAGAEVWVDGRNTGKRTPVAISSALELSVGKHKVIFKLNGKASPPQEVVITDGEVSILKGIEIPGA